MEIVDIKSNILVEYFIIPLHLPEKHHRSDLVRVPENLETGFCFRSLENAGLRLKIQKTQGNP